MLQPVKQPVITLPIQIKYLNSIDIEKLQTNKPISKKITNYDEKLTKSINPEKYAEVKAISKVNNLIQEKNKIILNDINTLHTIEKNIKIFSNTIRSNSIQIDPFIIEYKRLSLKIKNNQKELEELNIQYYKINNNLEIAIYKDTTPKSIKQPVRRTNNNIMYAIRKQPCAFIIDPNNTNKSKYKKLLSNYTIFNTGLGAVINTDSNNTNINNKHNCVCQCIELSALTSINIYMYYIDILDKHNNKLIDNKLQKNIQENTRENNTETLQKNTDNTSQENIEKYYKNDDDKKNNDENNYKKYMKYKNKYLQLKYL